MVRLDFAGGGFGSPERLDANLEVQFDELEARFGIERRYERPQDRFRHLIWSLHERTGQRVAVLVDEYDKPILDTLDRVENIRRVAEVARLMDQQSLRTARSA